MPESTWRTDRSERTDPKEMSVRSGAPGMGSQGRIPTDVGDTPWCSHGDPLVSCGTPFRMVYGTSSKMPGPFYG